MVSLRFFCVKAQKEVIVLDFYMKLPRNKKEFSLFVLIVSVLSVNVIAPLILINDIKIIIRKNK